MKDARYPHRRQCDCTEDNIDAGCLARTFEALAESKAKREALEAELKKKIAALRRERSAHRVRSHRVP